MSLYCILAFFFLPAACRSGIVKSRCGARETPTVQETPTRSPLTRIDIRDALYWGAVCNDGSVGIYYMSRTNDSNKWIIYMEGGVGCGTLDGCNERYVDRPELMTSRLYPSTIAGRDIFSSDLRTNPDYWDYNMVLMPYCTSDLWVGNSAWDPSRGAEQFRFNSSATYNQFHFRGSTVFRRVVDELLEDGLDSARDVVLVGSSAGGIGAMNQAGWLQSQLSVNCMLSVILDSSWFINFGGNLAEKFDFRYIAKNMNFLSHSPCRDVTTGGIPCCVSAPCMLSKVSQPTSNLSFPDIPVFAIFSQYDLFILSESLRKLENETDDVRQLEAFRTIAEYGRAMTIRLEDTSWKARRLSYFVPSCLQHVYLVTSDLRETGGILRTDANLSNYDTEHSSDTTYFRSAIEPGHWEKTSILRNASFQVTIRCALHEWNQRIHSKDDTLGSDAIHVRYVDDCFGARCNPTCPEKILLGLLNELWPNSVNYTAVALIITVTILCLCYKAIMIWKQRSLLNSYRQFINWTEMHPSDDKDSMDIYSVEEAIGIACLNVGYSVRLSADAIARARKLQKQRIAIEEEARVLFGYSTRMFDIDTHRWEAPSNKGALSDLLAGSSWTRIVGLPSDTLKADKENLETTAINSKDTDSKDGHSVSNRQTVDASQQLQNGRLETQTTENVEVPKHEDSEKTILNGISSYFNPGQLVAIMGPSGCGKTTFLDLLTGRRSVGRQRGEIFINGIPFNCLRDWYVKNTGYVLQLAVPYYEELTVRQNLLLAAFMRLQQSCSDNQRFKRVENVIAQTGLDAVKDTVVGGTTGPGLSGGQKRRLAVAIQLLNMPKVIFLDEPTSGLDATSSMELLQHLRCVAVSGRLVVLTIHQPRLEIFHMVDRILLLCQGQVAYFGSPTEAPALFMQAYQVAKLEGEIPLLDHTKNPADVIMDMLGSESYRKAILNYYKMTFELKAVKNAIQISKRNDSAKDIKQSTDDVGSGWMNRILVLETRACLRMTPQQTLYLPIIFLLFSLVAGLAYLQADAMLLIMAAFSIYSFTSSIFMFPPIYYHLTKAVEIYRLEKADGIGRSIELLLQTFLSYVARAAIPLVVCSLILCLMVLPSKFWSFERVFHIAIFTLASNQTWTAISIMLVCMFPVYGHKVSPLVSCAAGFAGGFLIPPSRMPIYFKWLLYINPNYYGYAGMLRVLLPTIDIGCNHDSTIECYPSTGKYWLADFGLHDVQPHMFLLILLVMSVAAFLFAWVAMEAHHSSFSLREWILLFCKSKKKDIGFEDSPLFSEEDDDSDYSSESPSLKEFQVATPSVVETSDNEQINETRTPDQFLYPNDTSQQTNPSGVYFEEPHTPERTASLRRRSTRTALLRERKHSVFISDSLPTDMHSGCSRRKSLHMVRRSVAMESINNRLKMESSIKKFSQMQQILEASDGDIEAMEHDVPLKKLYRRFTTRQQRVSVVSGKSQTIVYKETAC